MVLLLPGGKQPRKEPPQARDGNHEGLGGVAGAAAPPGQLGCRRARPLAGCDAVRLVRESLPIHLGDSGLDADPALHGLVSGPAAQAARAQATALKGSSRALIQNPLLVTATSRPVPTSPACQRNAVDQVGTCRSTSRHTAKCTRKME